MRQITETKTIYKFGDNKEVDEKIKDNMAYNWDLYEHNMVERIDTLKKLADLLYGDLDYSLSCVPDRGEFIKITPIIDELNFQALWEVIISDEACPLTGVCYDHDILDYLAPAKLTLETLDDALTNYIQCIHAEYESMLTTDYIADMCEANEYEFEANGKLY
jgi:hypothetical protein